MRPLLYGLAFVWRRLLVRTTFVGITGSLGKTTAKECLAGILASRAPTYRTWRNQNSTNLTVLNVLRVRPWHRYGVLELAGSGPGTLWKNARLVAPDVAVILPVTATHTRQYRDLDEHAAEKEVLLRTLRAGGVAILNADDHRVAAMAARTDRRVVLVGQSEAADFRAEEISSVWPARLTFRVRHGDRSQRIETQLVGEHWLATALAAVAAGACLGIPLPQIADVLRKVPPFPGRLEPVRLPNGAIVLRDDYNASTVAVTQALTVLEHASARRRIVVLTDFSDFEGNRRRRLQFLAPRIARAAEAVVIVGEDSKRGARRMVEAGMPAAGAHGFSALPDAAEFLRRELRDGDLVLLKGRTTDHAARLLLAQFGDVRCWKPYCAKRMLCDICWELGLSDRQLAQIQPAEPLTS